MRALAVVIVVVAGCGRIGFDASTRADGSGSSADADLASGAFSAPVRITAISTALDEEEATFTDDLLELIYRAGPSGNDDLFVSKRASPSAPWGAPTPIAELNSPMDDSTPAITGDGLTMWFSSSRNGSLGGLDIWVTSRPDRASPWSTPTNVAELNTSSDESGPMVDSSGIWFNRVSSMYELWRATPASPTTWNPPQLVTELNSGTNESAARTWAGGLRIVFNTTRTDLTSTDIWEASRASVADPFSNLHPIAELDTTGNDDWDLWISPDGHYGVFGSNRGGDYDLYEVSR